MLAKFPPDLRRPSILNPLHILDSRIFSGFASILNSKQRPGIRMRWEEKLSVNVICPSMQNSFLYLCPLMQTNIIFVKYFTQAHFQNLENLPQKTRKSRHLKP